MKLARLQDEFSGWLRTGSEAAAGSFAPGAAAGLAIYQNNYRAQLAACLEDAFAKTRQWIGDEAFHEAVVVHVERIPPSSWTLDAYPRDFPATLALLWPDDAEVAELAALELALTEAFVGADAPTLDPATLGAVDWDRAALHFVPTLDLQPLTTNAPAIWSALTTDEPPPPVGSLPAPGSLLTWRAGELARFRVLEEDEADAIVRIRSGLCFAGLCAHIAAEHGESDGIALTGAWLGAWIAEGLIAEISEGEN